jgi:hypothetical protein
LIRFTADSMGHCLWTTPWTTNVQMVHATCCLAGSASYLNDIRADLHDRGICRAVSDHDTPVLFDWLIEALSFQGISDSVASGYMAEHGSVCWSDIAETLSRSPSCPKLGGYWRFYDCRYRKGTMTCAEPRHIAACPLPRQALRNGHLNQMACVGLVPSACLLRQLPLSSRSVRPIASRLPLTAASPGRSRLVAASMLTRPLAPTRGRCRPALSRPVHLGRWAKLQREAQQVHL